MNTSNSTVVYVNKDQYLRSIGSTWIRDSIVLFGITPICFFGVLFNLTTFKVLSTKKFYKLNLYTYLRVYSLNSALDNFLCLFFFVSNCQRYFEFCYSGPFPSYYLSYVYVPLRNSFLFMASLLDICISVERNSQFLPILKPILKFNPRYVCLTLISITAAVNLQYYFLNTPTAIDLKLNSTTNLRYYFSKPSDFSKSLPGTILNNSTYIFRDVVLLAFQTILNIIMLIYFKRHLNAKQKIVLGHEKVKHEDHDTKVNEVQSKIEQKLSKSDRNLTLPVVVITLFTSVEHIFQNVSIVYLTFFRGETSYLFICIATLIICFKNFSNLIIFSTFNKVFRVELKKFFGVVFLNKNSLARILRQLRFNLNTNQNIFFYGSLSIF